MCEIHSKRSDLVWMLVILTAGIGLAAAQQPAGTGRPPAPTTTATASGTGLDAPRMVVVDEMTTAVRKSLAKRIPKVEFNNLEFNNVIQFLRDVANINFHPNWAKLQNADVTKDTPVTLTMTNPTVAEVLRQVLTDLGKTAKLSYAINEGVITISTEDDLKANADFAWRAGQALVKVPAPGDEVETLQIKQVSASVRIHGRLAQTEMTLVFHNPHDRVLAGDLYFPLPEGATVSGYALDVNGRMVEGVAVEKDKGRRVFEKEMRKGIDPGLIEWVKGNNFRTRVFPITAHGERTVAVKFVSEVTPGADGATWRLPLNFRQKVAQVTIWLEVVRPAAAPGFEKGATGKLQFEKVKESYVATASFKDQAMADDIVITLPKVDSQTVLVEQGADGRVYFAIDDKPDRPVLAPPAQAKRIAVLWDASGSRGLADHKRELDILKGVLKGRDVAVDLVVFRNAAEKPRTFEIVKGDASALTAELENVAYDGGTQMGCIPPAGLAQPGFYLLFSDGNSNFGAEQPSGFNAPLYAVSADPTANHAFLRSLADAAGGQYFNLSAVKDQAAIDATGSPSFSFLSATVEGGQTAGVYPSSAQPISGRFMLAGRLAQGAKSAHVVVNYGFLGGGPAVKAEFDVSAADVVAGDMLRRLWAQKRLDELMIFPRRNERAIVELGKEHGLVTPFTSLIVLENIEQYCEHEIAPPRSLKEMRDQYMVRMDRKADIDKQDDKKKVERVLALWNKRVEWWEKKFEYPKDLKVAAVGQPSSPNGAVVSGDGGAYQVRDLIVPAPAFRGPVLDLQRQSDTGGRDLREAEIPWYDYVKYPKDWRQITERREPFSATAAGETPTSGPAMAVTIKAWDPKTPYIAELKAAIPAKRFDVYMAQKAIYGRLPAFYLDCGDFFLREGPAALGLQVLSNIAEMEFENTPLVRVLAYRLAQAGELDLAAGLFEEALRRRPEEPQSHRDLALVLAQRAQKRHAVLMAAGRMTPEQYAEHSTKALVDYRRSLELLAKVVVNKWDRFDEIEVIALMELNRTWDEVGRLFPRHGLPMPVDERLIRLLDCDVRIVLTWDADMTDIDLHVIEPTGEEAFYSHNRTTIGGLVSHDFTQGYGPEEYVLRKGAHGVYKINVNYFGSRTTGLQGPTTVQVDVFTNYGRPNETKKGLTLRLAEQKDTALVGEIEY